MSIITSFNFDKKIFNLKTSYQNIYTTNDILLFQLEVLKSLKILSYLLQTTRDKRNIFANNMPSDLLLYIFSFLPRRYVFSNSSICKNWNSIFANFLKIKFPPRFPIGYNPLRHYKKIFDKNYKKIINNNKNIFFLYDDYISCYDNNLKFVSIFDIVICSAAVNNEYLLCYFSEFKLYSFSEKKIVKKWKNNNYHITDLAMCEKYIYIINEKNIIILDFDGKLIKQWDFQVENYDSLINITINNDEIFITDSRCTYIKVFSFHGKLLRRIKCYNSYLKKSYEPFYITISDNIIYITTHFNNVIMVFDYDGNFIFNIDSLEPLYDIISSGNQLYVSNDESIFSCNLLYNK